MAILSVSQLNRYVGFLMKGDHALQSVLIRGEISNFTNHYRSGHFYFTLRDEQSGIKAVMFRQNASRLAFTPQEGMRVIVSGSAALYEKEGVFQLYVTDMQPDGAGAQALALEERKKKLRAMGVFDDAAKRSLPPLPQHIGVVTSDTGAALQDIQNVMSRRYPIGHLHIYPAQVQGEAAPRSICQGIAAAEAGGCDVIIVGRGGGAAEDLAAFQTEEVVLAIYHCAVPVVSAVGHETDWTLADAAADLRAPTPSAAAELTVPDLAHLKQTINTFQCRLDQAMQSKFVLAQQQLERLKDKLQMQTPYFRQQLAERQLDAVHARFLRSGERLLQRRAEQFRQAVQRLELLSPLKILGQGYALVYHGEALLHDAKQVHVGDTLEIRLEQGSIQAEVIGTEAGKERLS